MALQRHGIVGALAIALATLSSVISAQQPPPKYPKLITTTDRDASFWNDWHDRSQSPAFKQLERDTGTANVAKNAVAEGRASDRQPIANIAVDSADAAARLLAAAAKSNADRESREALEAIAMLRTSPDDRADAIRQMPPETKAAAATFVANLSTGIPGLPGIYLNDSPIQRSPAPAGYAPVAGGSRGCPSRE